VTVAVGSTPVHPRAQHLVPNLALFAESLFAVAFIPLLPHLARTLGLTLGQAGFVGGSYAAGVLIGTVPA
jgi:predicted MFS family arabinose efflux permease